MAVFCAAAPTGISGSDRKVDMGERESSEEQNTWDKRAGFGSTRGGEVEWPGGGKSLVWSGFQLGFWQRGTGWSGDGHLIWIGSAQPNVSAGSQHAW